VIGRMRLRPKPDDYHPKLYVPTTSLWVQGTSKERNLSELAEQYTPSKDGEDRESETRGLMKPRVHFVHVDDLTKGSVAIEGETVVVGANTWDRIYSVALNSN